VFERARLRESRSKRWLWNSNEDSLRRIVLRGLAFLKEGFNPRRAVSGDVFVPRRLRLLVRRHDSLRFFYRVLLKNALLPLLLLTQAVFYFAAFAVPFQEIGATPKPFYCPFIFALRTGVFFSAHSVGAEEDII